MSLATRCPYCNTKFHVNQDQLKLYSGTVRCGVCKRPFNGIDHLIGRISSEKVSNIAQLSVKDKKILLSDAIQNNLSSETLKSEKIIITNYHDNHSAVSITHKTTDSDIDEISDETSSRFLDIQDDAIKSAFSEQLRSISLELGNSDSTEVAADLSFQEEKTSNLKLESVEPTFPSSIVGNIDKKEPVLFSDTNKKFIISNKPFEKTLDQTISSGSSGITPEVVQIVQKKQKNKGISGFFWSIAVIFLLLLLCTQFIYLYPTKIIAWWPPAEEFVNTACETLSCPIEQKSVDIKSISIMSEALKKSELLPEQFTQNITITNISSQLQPWPSLILELSDANNTLVLRRIVEPQEYLPELARMEKGLQTSASLSFQLSIEFKYDSVINSRILLLNP